MKSEIEEAVAPLGPVLELRGAEDERVWLRVAGLGPATLRAVWKLVVAVHDPDALSERMIGALAAPLTPTENHVRNTATIDYEEDGRLALEAQRASEEAWARLDASERDDLRLGAYGPEKLGLPERTCFPEIESANPDLLRRHYWKISPARLAAVAKARVERLPLQVHLTALLAGKSEALREARRTAEAAVEARYAAAVAESTARFETGDPNWRMSP